MEAGLEKRANCNVAVGKEAKVADAVWCIDYLARKGAQGTECRSCATATMCYRGTAEIWTVAGGANTCASTNW